MFPNHDDNLDPIAFGALLLLSGGQRFTFHDLVKSMNRPNEAVWEAVQTLQGLHYAKNERSKFMIDYLGVEYLIKRGILASEAEEEPKPKDFDKKFKPPFFPTWDDLVIWLGAPLAALSFSTISHVAITWGYFYISPDKIAKQIVVWVLFAVFLILYIQLSYHNVMENERLVVFKSGKVIGKRGPGHVLLLPLIHHPKKVDLRERAKEINHEPCITRDRILIQAGFFISWHIDDPVPCLTKVSNIEDSMTLLSTAVLRAAIAEYNMEQALEQRRALNSIIRLRIEQKAADWGVEINNTEIRELQPSDQMMKEIENRFKAGLERDATLTRSDATAQSLRQFLTIGEGMARNPVAMNLKYLDTLEKIGEGASSKYIIPMELFEALREWARAQVNQNTNINNPGNENHRPGQLPPGG